MVVAFIAGVYRGEEEAGIYSGIWECGGGGDSFGGEGAEERGQGNEVKKQ